jgi:Lon protease-like protein
MNMLPFFPLNTVLFPHVPISLHIFEERYKRMIARCLADRQPFGVVLLQQGTAEHQPGQEVIPYTVGCTAQITQAEVVSDGRMNIVAIGQERFHILSFDHSEPYLTGAVELIPIAQVGAARTHIQRGGCDPK